ARALLRAARGRPGRAHLRRGRDRGRAGARRAQGEGDRARPARRRLRHRSRGALASAESESKTQGMIRDFYRTLRPDHPPLRVGLLLDGLEMSRFAAGVVEDIVKSDFARVDFLVLRELPPAPPAPWHAMVTDAERRKYLAFTLYQRLDQRWFPVAADPTDR